jgi:hypothetical protein
MILEDVSEDSKMEVDDKEICERAEILGTGFSRSSSIERSFPLQSDLEISGPGTLLFRLLLHPPQPRPRKCSCAPHHCRPSCCPIISSWFGWPKWRGRARPVWWKGRFSNAIRQIHSDTQLCLTAVDSMSRLRIIRWVRSGQRLTVPRC